MLTSNPNSRRTRPKLLDTNIIAGNLQRKTTHPFDLRSDDTPDRIIDSLVRGNQQFVAMRAQNITSNSQSLSAAAQGKTPLIAVLNYARLPTSIEHIFGHKFSEIFALDSAAQLPRPQEIGALEYAALFLGVKVIIILAEAIDSSLAEVSASRRQIQLETKHRKLLICDLIQADLPPTLQQKRLTRLNVSPLLCRFIATGKLRIICGEYDPARATVMLFDRSV